jgi:hypothetical protein
VKTNIEHRLHFNKKTQARKFLIHRVVTYRTRRFSRDCSL